MVLARVHLIREPTSPRWWLTRERCLSDRRRTFPRQIQRSYALTYRSATPRFWEVNSTIPSGSTCRNSSAASRTATSSILCFARSPLKSAARERPSTRGSLASAKMIMVIFHAVATHIDSGLKNLFIFSGGLHISRDNWTSFLKARLVSGDFSFSQKLFCNFFARCSPTKAIIKELGGAIKFLSS